MDIVQKRSDKPYRIRVQSLNQIGTSCVDRCRDLFPLAFPKGVSLVKVEKATTKKRLRFITKESS